MDSQLVTDEDIFHPNADPVVLVGEPGSLRGNLHLRNGGQEKIVLRQALVHKAPTRNEAAGESASIAQASLSATLEPGQEQHVKLSLSLDRHTPPGEYRAELEVAGRTREVLLHVTETVKLDISPKTIVIDQLAGVTIIKRVVFSNNGNVPLTIGKIGSVVLGQELLLSGSVRATLAAAGNQAKGLGELFAELIREEDRPIVKPVGCLDVRNLAGTFVLQPAEIHSVDLEVHLPDKLERNSRYIGRVPLYTANLEFMIVPVVE